MNFLSITEFIGRFHPVVVHLPIGILLAACFMQLLPTGGKYFHLRAASKVLVLWGAITALLSCITGYLLSLNGDYSDDALSKHLWMGILTAAVSLMFYALFKQETKKSTLNFIALLTIGCITITGHLGGSLTHGQNFLLNGLNSADTVFKQKQINNVQEALVYSDIVQPIFQQKCYSCHSSQKQKGNLRLDGEEFILKGGKSGKTIVSGKADKSEMVLRMLLPHANEDHMPPKEKPQPTTDEIKMIEWWINSGHSFTKKVKDLPLEHGLTTYLKALETGSVAVEQTPEIPEVAAPTPNYEVIEKLKKANVIVIPVVTGSNYLSLNFVSAGKVTDSIFRLLPQLSKNIVWLKVEGQSLSDSSIAAFGKLKNLTRLSLRNSNFKNEFLHHLNDLSRLQILNLTGTKVNVATLQKLTGLKQLKHLYLYQSAVKPEDLSAVIKTFPGIKADTGNYTVPTLITDTTLVKY